MFVSLAQTVVEEHICGLLCRITKALAHRPQPYLLSAPTVAEEHSAVWPYVLIITLVRRLLPLAHTTVDNPSYGWIRRRTQEFAHPRRLSTQINFKTEINIHTGYAQPLRPHLPFIPVSPQHRSFCRHSINCLVGLGRASKRKQSKREMG